MKSKRAHILAAVLILVFSGLLLREQLRTSFEALILNMKGQKTVADRVAEFGQPVQQRLAPAFKEAEVEYPPKAMTLVGLKTERILQVWVAGITGKWKHLKDYPILGISGVIGPKLREGDGQVPEGIYRVESLNPNSLFHVALRVNYPNSDDRRRGQQDGRRNLGSDIMIHGKDRSIGCLAMGDEASEDLFVMAAAVGLENVSVILSPVDFRLRALPEQPSSRPAWVDELYALITNELESLGGAAPASGAR